MQDQCKMVKMVEVLEVVLEVEIEVKMVLEEPPAEDLIADPPATDLPIDPSLGEARIVTEGEGTDVIIMMVMAPNLPPLIFASTVKSPDILLILVSLKKT